MKRTLWNGSAAFLLILLATGCTGAPVRVAPSAPERVVPSVPARPSLISLVVAGGPDRAHNQVAIESNARYVSGLLPAGAPYRLLFADGSTQSDDVQFRGRDGRLAYRAPDLPRLDGGADATSVRAALAATAADAARDEAPEILLYFTGHGRPDVRSGYANNAFDLWAGQEFTVQNLASALRAFPPSSTITLVMVQCFSGAFANVLFQDGAPAEGPVDQHIAGFFAASAQRIAAGCTPDINEAGYVDFTSFFFAALTGADRRGAAVTGADYGHDGRVGMNEAFAYALLHDTSIDTPVCTSDALLRRFAPLPDSEVFGLSYAKVRSWADPAQTAVLDGLSQQLGLSGDGRLTTALAASKRSRNPAAAANGNSQEARFVRFVEITRSIVFAHFLEAGSDETLKARLAGLLKAERSNPLR